jgi:hypothetical protein
MKLFIFGYLSEYVYILFIYKFLIILYNKCLIPLTPLKKKGKYIMSIILNYHISVLKIYFNI